MNMKDPRDNAAPETAPKKKRVTSKQVVAMTGVTLLLILYIATLIVAIVDRSASGRWFWMCLIATMAVPLLIWIYTWLYGKLTRKHTIADFDLNASREPSAEGAAEASDTRPK